MATESTPAWEVTGQVEGIETGPTGTFTRGVRVSFRTVSGAIGSVFVPADQWTVAHVRELVADAAGKADAVQTLKG